MVNSKYGYVPTEGLAARLKTREQFYDRVEADRLGLDEHTLITPVTPYNRRIRYRMLEFDPLIDSSNVKSAD